MLRRTAIAWVAALAARGAFGEVSVFEDRRVGKSKMSRRIFLEAVTMVWRLRAGGGR